MVSRTLSLGLLAVALVGCADKIERDAVKTEALTLEQQIENIRKAEGMPEDVKAKTIAGLQAQINAKKASQPAAGAAAAK